VIFDPLTEQFNFYKLVTPVQFMASLFVGGVSSLGKLKLIISPLPSVRLLLIEKV